MRTPREILLAQHRTAAPKLDRIRHAVVAEIHNKETKTQSQSLVQGCSSGRESALISQRVERTDVRCYGVSITPHQLAGFVSWCLGCSETLGRKLWLELIWPCRRTWAGLAAAWLALVVFNLTQTVPARSTLAKSTTSPAELRMAFFEQQRLLTELIGPPLQPENFEPPRRKSTDQPRSERRLELLRA